jgi:hypothetical protein
MNGNTGFGHHAATGLETLQHWRSPRRPRVQRKGLLSYFLKYRDYCRLAIAFFNSNPPQAIALFRAISGVNIDDCWGLGTSTRD